MNEILNKALLVGDKLMPEMHLRQPKFTSNTCRPFTKNKDKIKKIKETGGLIYLSKPTEQSSPSTWHGLWKFYGFV